MENNEYVSHNIARKFIEFDKQIRNIWYEYIYLEEVISNTPPINIPKRKITGTTRGTLDSKRTGTLKVNFLCTKNSQSHFIDAIIQFEQFIYYLSEQNFTVFPKKLGTEPLSGQKLTKLIYDKNSIVEILESIIEEKNRKIFYGNPVDIFLKDPCKFGYKKYFEDNYLQIIKYFKQIIATRNIIIHNNSRVDSKYLKETKSTTYKNKEIVIISSEFLRESILILNGLITELTNQYLTVNFSSTYRSKHIKMRADKFKHRTLTNYFKSFD